MFISIQRLRTRYVCQGAGNPIILLHGWGTNLDSMENLVNHLSKSMKVFAVDLPGFGQTDFPPSSWSVDNYVDWVIDFMKEMGLGKADFIGHSFGGRICIKLAAQHSELINRLILMGSAGVRQSKPGFYRKLVLFSVRVGKQIAKIFSPRVMNKLRWKFYKSLGSTDYLTSGKLKGTYSLVISEDLEKYLNLISSSTLLIWGENDVDTPVQDGKLMGKLIKGAKLVIIKNAGHYSFQDNPKEVFLELDKFLD
jgi:pimeloyl-ACP methyl ester carboxylesterase